MIKNLRAFGYDFETFINVPNGGWWSCTFIEYANRNNKIVCALQLYINPAVFSTVFHILSPNRQF